MRQNENYRVKRDRNLAGFIQRGRDDEGTVPVELNTTDFSSMTCENVNFARRDRQNTKSLRCLKSQVQFIQSFYRS